MPEAGKLRSCLSKQTNGAPDPDSDTATLDMGISQFPEPQGCTSHESRKLSFHHHII